MPKCDWEKVRADIERLYVLEGKALAEVVEILAITRGFRASKSSFEKKLRQWGVVKHVMGEHRWSTVGRIIEKRKRAGKRSDVYVRGVMVSREKVQREVSRHVALTLRSKFPVGSVSPSPEPPDGVVICSPIPTHNDVAWDCGSPWTQFLAHLSRSGARGFMTGATVVHGNLESALSQAYTKVPAQWPCLGLVGSLGRRTRDEAGRIAALLESQNTMWVTEALGRIMPEEHPGQHLLMAREIGSNWTSQAGLVLRLFLLSNNFTLSDTGARCELHDQQVSALVDQLIPTGSKELERLLCTPSLVSDAIKAEVFPWALRHGRDDIVRLMLCLGCDPDPDITYAYRWEPFQSLQTAAFIRDKRTSARMIRTLLEYGAKIDNSLVHSALNIAIARGKQEAIHLLMAAGACLRLPSLAAAIWAGDNEMVRKVLDTVVLDINDNLPQAPLISGFAEWAALPHAAHRGHLHIVKTLLKRGADAAAVHRWSEFRSVLYCGDEQGLRTTALGIAVAAEQVETARFLAQYTSKETEELLPRGDYVFPLTIACLVGNEKIIKALLEARVNVTGADIIPDGLFSRMEWEKQQSFPKTLLELLIANWEGSEEQLVELCEMLIHRGARTDRALVAAVTEEKAEIARLLLHYGASPDTLLLPETSVSVLGLAIEMGNLCLAQMLYQAGAAEIGIPRNIKGVEMAEFLNTVGLFDIILREKCWLMLTEAIRGEGESQWLVNRILETELNFTGRYTDVLAAAVQHGLGARFITDMIDCGAAWTTFNLHNAIELAIRTDAPDDVIHPLLTAYTRIEKRSDSNTWLGRTFYLLFCVARYGSSRMLGIILKVVDWEPGKLGTALNHAIFHANYRVIQDLLDAGASLADDGCNGSPLYSAVVVEQVWLVKLLLSSGANVQDYNALASATRLGHIGLIEILLGAGTSPNGRAHDAAALQIASDKGFLGIVRKLIDAGADVNARGRVCDDAESGCYGLELTALTLAALEGRLETLHLLLSRGAVIHGPTGRGQYVDAVRAAAIKSHRAAAALLKSYGGWTESDERALGAKHLAAIEAMKAKQNTVSGSDECSNEASSGIAVTYAITVKSSAQDESDFSLSTSQGCDKGDKATSTGLLKELPRTEMSDWPHDWADEGDTSSAAMHTEFSGFFFEELSRLQDHTGEDDGWSVGSQLFAN